MLNIKLLNNREERMSILEIELKLETRQRLNRVAARRGVPASELVQAAVEKLLEAA